MSLMKMMVCSVQHEMRQSAVRSAVQCCLKPCLHYVCMMLGWHRMWQHRCSRMYARAAMMRPT